VVRFPELVRTVAIYPDKADRIREVCVEQYLVWALVLLGVTIGLTVGIFLGRRSIGPGPKKGTAANPAAVRRQNPPDAESVHSRP
jgi:hypothetical protein